MLDHIPKMSVTVVMTFKSRQTTEISGEPVGGALLFGLNNCWCR